MFNLFKKGKPKSSLNPEFEKLVTEIHKQKNWIFSARDLSGIKEYEDLKELPHQEQKQLILGLVDFIVQLHRHKVKHGKSSYNSSELTTYGETISEAILAGLMRKRLNYTEDEWIVLFESYKQCDEALSNSKLSFFGIHKLPISYSIKQIEYLLKDKKPSPSLHSYILDVLNWDSLKPSNQKQYYGSDLQKAASKLKSLIQEEKEDQPFELLTPDIGKAVMMIIDSITQDKSAFDQAFHIIASASASKPTRKFKESIAHLQNKIGSDHYRRIAHEILTVAIETSFKEETSIHVYGNETYEHTQTQFLCSPSQDFLKGLVWTMERYSDKETIRILSRLVEKSYTKISGVGPAAAGLGNACFLTLANMRGKDGLGALSRLKLKIKQHNAKKTIDKYLYQGAKKYKVSVEELKEMAVPDFQLNQGVKTYSLDSYSCEIQIKGIKATLTFFKQDGTPLRSVPSAIKNGPISSKRLKAIRQEVKEIQKVFSAQKQHIDNQFIQNRSWDMASFQKYYLDHGLVFPLASKLIWTFSKNGINSDAILINGQWQAWDNTPVDWIDQETRVSLWHPINADEETILNWRNRVIELEWKQPVKQAFREIYILTDAELNTRTYSNRMAAHILKQHQFSTLANLRGWKYSLLGAFDNGMDNGICQKELSEYGITAEYWIDELNQNDGYNDTGIWLHIATDQVKFKDESDQAMDLVDIPIVVFSEIMRDVDMFVGVCSVGNDPQWMDNNGDRQTNRDYWTSYSFGDLNEISRTRKTILEGLLPRLTKIRDKARIEGKFLIVQGKLRTYKIHIGSGNILMEPNDQYLCIVPSRSSETSANKLFIPFEGDTGLSIVLSKAFLLAEDEKITDSTITSQIGRQ